MHAAGMLKRWRLDTAKDEAAAGALARALHLPPLLASLLVRRGLAEAGEVETFLNPKLTHLHDPALLPGVARAADRLEQAVRSGQKIVIYGDYDVDGVTASAILWHTLRTAGATASMYVPHRLEEGYGLNCEAIARLVQADADGRKPLIVSVDCGITACEPAEVARQAGVDLIITDHHEFDPCRLPAAHTLVHPRLGGDRVGRGSAGVSPSQGISPAQGLAVPGAAAVATVEADVAVEAAATAAYPFADLCGAGVAFKLAWQFARVHCGSDRLPSDFKALLLDLVSLAALGTVADVVPLRGENRVIVRHGLGQIKRTRFVGLNALIDASRLREETVDAYHVGFVLGPQINACGRMGHAGRALELLTTDDPAVAADLAQLLCRENQRRRNTERAIFIEAKAMVVEAGYDQPDCRVIVLGRAGWHAGVVGVVASRLVEAFSRPVVLLCYEGEEACGSARSVEGLSIHEAFAHCAEHLRTFGGHAMAAGLRLEVSRVEAFRAAMIQYVNARLAADALAGVFNVEGLCALSDLTLDTVEKIEQLAPFGRGNPAPLLCLRQVTMAQPAQPIGGNGRHLRLMLRQGPRFAQAVWFGAGELAERLPAGAALDIVFEPHLSTWQGRQRVEIHVKDAALR